MVDTFSYTYTNNQDKSIITIRAKSVELSSKLTALMNECSILSPSSDLIDQKGDTFIIKKAFLIMHADLPIHKMAAKPGKYLTANLDSDEDLPGLTEYEEVDSFDNDNNYYELPNIARQDPNLYKNMYKINKFLSKKIKMLTCDSLHKDYVNDAMNHNRTRIIRLHKNYQRNILAFFIFIVFLAAIICFSTIPLIFPLINFGIIMLGFTINLIVQYRNNIYEKEIAQFIEDKLPANAKYQNPGKQRAATLTEIQNFDPDILIQVKRKNLKKPVLFLSITISILILALIIYGVGVTGIFDSIALIIFVNFLFIYNYSQMTLDKVIENSANNNALALIQPDIHVDTQDNKSSKEFDKEQNIVNKNIFFSKIIAIGRKVCRV